MGKVEYRAWIKSLDVMAEVLSIDYADGEVVLKGHKRDTIARLDQVILQEYARTKDVNNIKIFVGDVIRGTLESGEEIIGYVMWNALDLTFDVVDRKTFMASTLSKLYDVEKLEVK